MKFSEVTRYYQLLEGTTKRLEMGDILVDLIASCPAEVLDKVLYLTRGRLFPDYSDVELGIADKLLLKTISTLKPIPDSDLEKKLVELGDLGEVAEFRQGRAVSEDGYFEEIAAKGQPGRGQVHCPDRHKEHAAWHKRYVYT